MSELTDITTRATATEPLVSVIIPVYNRLKFLDEAIRSALAQTYPNLEVVVVDDGSRLDPGPVVARFDSRVRLVRKANGGLSSARNFGTVHAAGDYLLFLDDDDCLEPDAVESLLQPLRPDPRAVWAAGKFDYVDEKLRPTQRRHACRYGSGDVYAKMIFNNLMGAPSVVLVRAAALRALGGFDETLLLSEDWDMWLTLAREYALIAIDKKVTNYRLHSQQISCTQWTRLFEHNLRVLAKHRDSARPDSRHLFELGIAKLHLRFGDALYVSGDHRRARSEWRLAPPAVTEVGWGGMAGRFAKSWLPSRIARTLRETRQITGVTLDRIRNSFARQTCRHLVDAR